MDNGEPSYLVQGALMKVIGLIALKDAAAFEDYRRQVGDTVAQYGGQVIARGRQLGYLWNELGGEDFQAYVELSFSSEAQARQWAASPEYQALLPVRSRAMKPTLFMVDD